jgi:hypothetical protein
MKRAALFAVVTGVGLASTGCVPDWAQQNSSPYIMEIAGITPDHVFSDVLTETGIINDDVQVAVNVFRKNNNPDLSTSAVEHVYLERYEVRYFRTDGRNQEGVDVPFRITGPLGNVRFHTAGPAAEQELTVPITIVRHQAKLEPPLRNLVFQGASDAGLGQIAGAVVMTTVAEITVHGRTVQGDALVAVGRVQVSFSNFADAAAPTGE